jgi:hypothetical protein
MKRSKNAKGDVFWYDGKTIVAYSTVSDKDYIDLLAEENKTRSFDGMKNWMIKNGILAKTCLDIIEKYIARGFGSYSVWYYLTESKKIKGE